MSGKKRTHGEPKEEAATEARAAQEEDEPEAKRQATEAGGTKEGTETLEDGEVIFLYRPRVGVEEPHSVADLQRLYMVLSPHTDSPDRLLIIGKKRLPKPSRHERYFGFVDAVSADIDNLVQGLGEKEYETKTLGKRKIAPARIAGKGVYSIVLHKNDTHFVYRLELPEEPGEVQEELGIYKEASYVLQIKNPRKGGPTTPGLRDKAQFPPEKMRLFEQTKTGVPGGYSWIAAKDPTFLDNRHAEILLIATTTDVKRELGVKVEQHLEEELKEDVEKAEEEHPGTPEHEALLDHLAEEVHAEDVHLELEPADGGKWK